MAYFESDFWHPSVATDIVLFTIRERKLNIRRAVARTYRVGFCDQPKLVRPAVLYSAD